MSVKIMKKRQKVMNQEQKKICNETAKKSGENQSSEDSSEDVEIIKAINV